MPVKKAFLIEVVVHGEAQGMTQTEYRAESVGAWTKVRNFTQELQAMFFRLQRIVLYRCIAQYLKVIYDDFHGLAMAFTL